MSPSSLLTKTAVLACLIFGAQICKADLVVIDDFTDPAGFSLGVTCETTSTRISCGGGAFIKAPPGLRGVEFSGGFLTDLQSAANLDYGGLISDTTGKYVIASVGLFDTPLNQDYLSFEYAVAYGPTVLCADTYDSRCGGGFNTAYIGWGLPFTSTPLVTDELVFEQTIVTPEPGSILLFATLLGIAFFTYRSRLPRRS